LYYHGLIIKKKYRSAIEAKNKQKEGKILSGRRMTDDEWQCNACWPNSWNCLGLHHSTPGDAIVG
jgi:hypothetical protein